MTKGTKNLILGVGLAGGGYLAGTAMAKSKAESEEPLTSGYPGVGAVFPSESALVPKKWQGQPTPVWFDAATWGVLGASIGYFLLAGKKL